MAFYYGQILKGLDICEKEVEVEGEKYILSSKMSYAKNSIHKSSSSLEVGEDGEININESFREICKSSSYLSIHGIDVPCSLFRNYNNFDQKAVLEFPFPIRLRLDVGSTNDLNLNSARTQIIYDECWKLFERQFTETIMDKLKATITPSVWNNMKEIFRNKTENQVFLDIVNGI